MELVKFIGENYQFDIPSNWYLRATPQFKPMAISPEDENGNHINLTISPRRTETRLNPRDVARKTQEQQKADYGDFEIIQESEFEFGNVDAYTHVYTFTPVEEQEKVAQRQLFLSKSNDIIIITATKPLSFSSEEIEDQVNTILTSFEIARSNQDENRGKK